MTLAEQLAGQSKTNPPGLATNFDTEERELGARIATGEVTFDDIVSGKVKNFGGVDFTFPNGINFNKNPVSDPKLQNKSFTGREGVQEILQSQEGTARLKAYFEKVKADNTKNLKEQPDDINVLYRDPLTKTVEQGVSPNKGNIVTNSVKFLSGYDTKPKAEQYVEISQDIDNTLKGSGVEDVLIRQIFTDHYEVGDFFTEMGKGLETAGKVIPYYLPIMAAALTDYYDGVFSDDENYFENRKQNREQFAASVRNQMEEDYNLRGLKRSDAMNDFVHKELKVRLEKMHGKDWEQIYKDNYLTQDGAEIPYISDDLATQLDDYAYKEMPTTNKLLKFASENALLGGLLSGRLVNKSIDVAKNVQNVRTAGTYTVKRGNHQHKVLNKTQIDALSDRQIEMLIGVDNSANKFMAYLNTRLYGIGNGFKVIGKADLGANELRQINTITDLTNRIGSKLADIKALRIQGLPKTNPEVVKLRNEVSTLVQAKNNQTILRMRRSPIFMGNQKDELLVAFGQAYGYELGGAIPYLSPEGGELLGALSMAFHLHSRPMGAVGSVFHFADRALNNFFGTGTTDTINLIDSAGAIFSSIDPRIDISGTLVNRDLENLQKAYYDNTGKYFTQEQSLALKQLTNLTKNMQPTERTKLVSFLKDSTTRQEELLKAFPEDMRAEAKEVYKQTFGAAAQIPGVLVYEGSLSSKLHVNDLDNFNIKDLNAAVDQTLTIVRQNELFAKRFLDLGQKGKLKPDEYAKLETFVNDTKQGVAQLKEHMTRRAEDFELYIDKYFENIMITPTDQASVAFDQNMLQDVIDSLTNIRVLGAAPVGEGASLVNQTEIMKKTHDEVINKAYNHLFKAASSIDQIKHTTDGVRYSEIIAEKLYD